MRAERGEIRRTQVTTHRSGERRCVLSGSEVPYDVVTSRSISGSSADSTPRMTAG